MATTRKSKTQAEISDGAAARILQEVHAIARWLTRLQKAEVSVDIRLEEPILDAVLDALGVPRDRRRREPLYVAFYTTQDRALTERELNILIQAAKELARGEDPDALEALGEDY